MNRLRPFRWPLVPALLLTLARPSAMPAETSAETQTLSLGAGVTLEMRQVEPGTFTRPPAAAGKAEETPPPRPVIVLTRPFLLGVRPVTRGQFARFVAESGHRTEAEIGRSGGFGFDGHEFTQRPGFSWRDPGFAQTDADPVVLVTRGDAEAFLRWLSATLSRECALPTEAQWELAAHAGLPGEHPDGQPTHRRDSAAPSPAPGPRRDPWRNALGLDLLDSGVHEWVQDWDGPAPTSLTDPVQDNPNAASPARGILRGRSWFRDLDGPLSFHQRHRASPGSRQADIGFRVLMLPATPSVTPTAPAPAALIPPSAETAATPAETPSPPESSAFSPSPDPSPAPASEVPAGRVFALLLVGAAVFVAAVALLFPRRRRPVPAVPTAGFDADPARVEAVDDGFWVHSDVPEGTTLRCVFNVGTDRHERTVRFQPGPRGMFVGTGQRPSGITIAPAVGPSTTSTGGTENFSSGSYLASGGIRHSSPPTRQRFREPGAY